MRFYRANTITRDDDPRVKVGKAYLFYDSDVMDELIDHVHSCEKLESDYTLLEVVGGSHPFVVGRDGEAVGIVDMLYRLDGITRLSRLEVEDAQLELARIKDMMFDAYDGQFHRERWLEETWAHFDTLRLREVLRGQRDLCTGLQFLLDNLGPDATVGDGYDLLTEELERP